MKVFGKQVVFGTSLKMLLTNQGRLETVKIYKAVKKEERKNPITYKTYIEYATIQLNKALVVTQLTDPVICQD